MTFAAPTTVIPTSDERELLLRFLHRQREEVAATAAGLSDGQARWTPEGRLLPIIGIINHLAHAESRGIDRNEVARSRYVGGACRGPAAAVRDVQIEFARVVGGIRTLLNLSVAR